MISHTLWITLSYRVNNEAVIFTFPLTTMASLSAVSILDLFHRAPSPQTFQTIAVLNHPWKDHRLVSAPE